MNFTQLEELYQAFGPILSAAKAAETERLAKAAELAAAVDADRLATEAAATRIANMVTALDAFVAASKPTVDEPTE
jgi:hypothetical protein